MLKSLTQTTNTGVAFQTFCLWFKINKQVASLIFISKFEKMFCDTLFLDLRYSLEV